MNIERRNDIAKTATNHAIGAFVSVLFAAFLAWIGGFVDMKNDVKQLGRDQTEMKVSLATAQKDIADLKINGFKADAELDKRVSVMEQQHQEMLRHPLTQRPK